MGIHSFLKAEKGDPDWQFSPEHYFGKEWKIIDASTIEIKESVKDMMVLRQNPTERNLLAKHIKIESKPESQLDLVVINEADNKLQQVFLYDVHLHQNSTINFGIFVQGGKFNKHIIQVAADHGSTFNIYGLLSNTVGGDTELITKVIHQNIDTHSRQFILNRAGENSQTVYQAMVILDDGSDHSQAFVESSNLIVGNKGRCFTKPEIYSNIENVKYSMGTYTEHLDAEKIYYLQTRGLDPTQAVRTVVSSFQSQAIDLIPSVNLREEIAQIFNV